MWSSVSLGNASVNGKCLHDVDAYWSKHGDLLSDDKTGV
jgi:hypothetical protein